MSLYVGLLILIAFAVPFALALRRANELFCIRAKKGRAELVRGRLPPRLLHDLDDVVERARLDGVEIRVVVEARRPRVVARGAITDGQLQRLRNVVGRYEVLQIRRGTRRA